MVSTLRFPAHSSRCSTPRSSLLLRTPLSLTQRDYMEAIAHSGEDLRAMVGDALDMGQLETGKFALERKPFSLAALVSEGIARSALLSETRLRGSGRGRKGDELFSSFVFIHLAYTNLSYVSCATVTACAQRPVRRNALPFVASSSGRPSIARSPPRPVRAAAGPCKLRGHRGAHRARVTSTAMGRGWARYSDTSSPTPSRFGGWCPRPFTRRLRLRRASREQ